MFFHEYERPSVAPIQNCRQNYFASHLYFSMLRLLQGICPGPRTCLTFRKKLVLFTSRSCYIDARPPKLKAYNFSVV
jgi:hypothetical protein